MQFGVQFDINWHAIWQQMKAICLQGTEHLFNTEMIANFKKGSYLVNTARGKICETQAVVDALESGQLRGYAGDVWYPQPAPKDHPWRSMKNHAMTPHYSGTTLDAQVCLFMVAFVICMSCHSFGSQLVHLLSASFVVCICSCLAHVSILLIYTLCCNLKLQWLNGQHCPSSCTFVFAGSCFAPPFTTMTGLEQAQGKSFAAYGARH